jgi:hypothetical protein
MSIIKQWSVLAALIITHGLTLHFTTAAEITPTRGGIEIKAGSMGNFMLAYPEFLDQASATVHPVVDAKVQGGQVTVKYEGGGEADIMVSGGDLTINFKNVSTDVKSWKMTMLIDINFGKGGTWKVGDTTGDFPPTQPANPHLTSISASAFSFKNAQGQSLSIAVPDYAFQQITDFRQWNWATYQWQFFVPYSTDKATAKLHITSELNATVKLIDVFGQSIKTEFPQKLKSLADLKADLTADQAYYAGIQTPQLDHFGGAPNSGTKLGLKKTGFFHIEQKQNQSWLVDPEGNAFFHLGVCVFSPNDDYTYVKGREEIYEWLPTINSEFSTAFREGDPVYFSYYLANTIKKFDQPFDYETYSARMINRVKKWGFNSMGAFSRIPQASHITANFPYVGHLPINAWEGVPRIPGAHEVWDPYDVATTQKIQDNLAQALPIAAKDPLLIGWFIVNEPRFDDLPRIIPSLYGKHACKRELVKTLQTKYKNIAAYNTAWNAHAQSFDELLDTGLAVTTDAATADIHTFVSAFLETYFTQIETAVRKYDPNHLLLGCRLQPITINDEQLCKIMGQHVDVVSYNYYTYGVDQVELKKIHEWTGKKPLMLSEFFWASSHDSGLVGGREVSSQQERGFAYRNYVEQSASLGFVVGIQWFTLVDQATTGRWFSHYNGESYNTGLISVSDRPWKEMLSEMMKTNHEIYDVLLHKRKPFAWNDPRFTGSK